MESSKMRISILTALLLSVVAGCSKQPASNSPAEQQAAASAPASGPAMPVPPAAAPEARILSFEGYGPVRFGAKLSDVEQQLGVKSEPLGENDPACSSVRFKPVPGVRFMVEKGVITRADADAGTANSLGLAVGDTLAQAKEKVPSIDVGPHKYLPAGHYLTVKSPDAGAAIILEEDGKAITKIRAGLQPAVGYVEVCL
jgi:hypothetical protein